MITSEIPTTWQQLQIQVSRILKECGFDVEVEKVITTARGKVELDVYAEETVKGRKYCIAIECKHWKHRVPQNVIHGFRTVCNDIGTNQGYIVTLNGFQAGAFSAADLTNLNLVTWEQFQTDFFQSWYENHFIQRVAEDLDSIMTYAEPIYPEWFEVMTEVDKAVYLGLKRKYDVFGIVMQSFSPWARMIDDSKIPTLPLIDRLIPSEERDTIPEEILKTYSYREFLEKSIAHGNYATSIFNQLRDKYKKNMQ